MVAELAVMRLLEAHKGEKAVYIGPLKSLVREKLLDWKDKFEGRTHHRVIELTGDSAPELGQLQRADIIVTTPEKWDGVSRMWEHRDYVKKVSLIIIDEIHLLGADRGPIIEVIVSRLRFIAQKQQKHVRVIGLSTALANATDLADWLGIHGTGLYNFSHSVRPVQLIVIFAAGVSRRELENRLANIVWTMAKSICAQTGWFCGMGCKLTRPVTAHSSSSWLAASHS